ncbi:MAG: hypothetical protein WDW38_009214 [Sanguina aurantia]
MHTSPKQAPSACRRTVQVLKSKGADGAGMGIKRAMASERIAYAYMNEHSPGLKTPEQLKEFLKAVEVLMPGSPCTFQTWTLPPSASSVAHTLSPTPKAGEPTVHVPTSCCAGEVLQLLNLAPTSAVEVNLVVEECEGRLSDAQVEALLDVVATHLRG